MTNPWHSKRVLCEVNLQSQVIKVVLKTLFGSKFLLESMSLWSRWIGPVGLCLFSVVLVLIFLLTLSLALSYSAADGVKRLP